MLDQLSIDFAGAQRVPTSRELKERALDRVTRGQEDWIDSAIALLRDYLARFVQAEFRIEQFRAYALAAGLPAPRSHHAWGALPRAAVAAGLIEWTGRFEPATSARTHGHPVRVDRRVR